jgi:hypothetical protein
LNDETQTNRSYRRRFHIASLVGQIIGVVIGTAIGALVGALVVRFSTNLVAKFAPPFGMAYKASFLGAIATYLIGFVFGVIVAATGNELSSTGYILLSLIGFFVYAAILGPIVKHPETGPIGFQKACLVNLAQVITMVVIIGGVVLLVSVMIK